MALPFTPTSSAKQSYDYRCELADILYQLMDVNGICKTCGNDHSFQPDFEGVKISIDSISELFRKRLLNA
jgi:hypothetical protein